MFTFMSELCGGCNSSFDYVPMSDTGLTNTLSTETATRIYSHSIDSPGKPYVKKYSIFTKSSMCIFDKQPLTWVLSLDCNKVTLTLENNT